MSNEVEKWQLKKLIKNLKELRGSGTSVISQYIPPNTNVSQYVSRLQSEYGLADANIKSATNKKSVLEAITSACTRLKEYHKTGENGLVVLAGNVNVNGREKRMSLAITPFKPLNRSIYHCDSKFLLDPLEEILQDSQKYGFIIMDGSETLFGTVQGQQRNILKRKNVTLPKKHKKGGQSSQRFQRIRLEKRHAYIKEVSDLATKHFISENLLNVEGVILAGHAEFKKDLSNASFLDPRLKEKVIAVVDIAYGGEPGFNQAIDLVKEQLGHLELIQEVKVIKRLFDEITNNSGLCIFGANETIEALNAGVVNELLLSENFEQYYDPETNRLLKIPELDDQPLFVDWIAEHYGKLGVELHFITGQTSEGHQFIRGFGGIAGILRYPYTPIVEQEVETVPQQDGGENNNAEDGNNGGNNPGGNNPEVPMFTEDDFM